MRSVHEAFANGLTWGFTPVPNAAHASLIVDWPLGVASDPVDAQGAAPLLYEWLLRGSGGRDARATADAFAAFGVRRGGSVGRARARFAFTFLVIDAKSVTALVRDLLCAPALRDDEFEGARRLLLGGRATAAEDPIARLEEAIHRARYRPPWNRSPLGRAADLRRLTPEALRAAASIRLTPLNAFVAVAGGGEAALWRDLLADAFGSWTAAAAAAVPAPSVRCKGVHHRSAETAQTHVALVDDAEPPTSPHHLVQAIAATALAGGHAAPLWREVRERRALAYDVSSTVTTLAGDAFRVTTAATRPARAAATVRALVRVLTRERRVRRSDLPRFAAARDQLRTQLLLDASGAAGCAARLLHDLRVHGRPRTLAERIAALAATRPEAVADFLRARGPLDLTRVTLGPEPVGDA